MFIYKEEFILTTAIGYAIIGLLALLIYFFFRNKNIKVRKNVLNILTGIILLLEIIKQIQNIIPGIDYGSLWFIKTSEENLFDSYALPFHLCSFFIFWPVAAFFTKGKVKDFFENLTATWATIIFFATILYPDIIYGEALVDLYNGEPLTHTTVFHLLVCLYFLLMISLRPFELSLKKVWFAPLGILIYGAIAAPFAFILKTNYCSIYEPHSFGFLIELFNKFGYGLYLPLIAIIGAVAASVFYLLAVGITKLVEIIKCPNGLFVGFCITEMLIIPFAIIYNMTGINNETLYLPMLLALVVIPSLISVFIFKKIFKTPIND